MSFAQGFNVGFGSVMSAAEMADRVARQKKEDEWMAEQRQWLRADRERQDTLRRDLAAASQDPVVTQGTAIGAPGQQVYSADPNTAAALQASMAAEAEMRGEPAPAASQASAVGNQIYNDPSKAAGAAAAGSGQLGRVKRMAEAYGRAGEADKQLALEQQYKALKKEGAIDALDLALNPAMQESDIEKAYNEAGSHRVKPGSLKREFYDVDMPGFGKVRTARIVATGEDGQEIRIENALGARMTFMPFEKRLDVQAKGVEAAQRDRQIGATERTADAAVLNAQSNEKYRENLNKQFEQKLAFDKANADRLARQWAASHDLAKQRLTADIDAAKRAGQSPLAFKDVEPQMNRIAELAIEKLGPGKDDPDELKDDKGNVIGRPKQEKLQYANDATVAAQGVLRAAAVAGRPLTANEAFRVSTEGQFNPRARLIQRNAAGEERTIEGPAFVMPGGAAFPVSGDVPPRFMPPEGPPRALAGAGSAPAPAAIAAGVPQRAGAAPAGPPGMAQQATSALLAAQAQTVQQLRAAQATGNTAEVQRLNQILIEQGQAIQRAGAR